MKEKTYIFNRLIHSNGFSLIESIVSIVLLTTTVLSSLYLISLRNQTIYKANLTRAINDEIRRDIEKLKLELWSYNYNELPDKNSYYYLPNRESCEDIGITITQLDSWFPSQWKPGENKLNIKGQVRNKIFKGSPITIIRSLRTDIPLINHRSSARGISIDKSVATIVYTVRRNDDDQIWTSINLSSEEHGWCEPNI